MRSLDDTDGVGYINAYWKGGDIEMIKEISAKILVRVARSAAVYAYSKASSWTHHQAKEPDMKNLKNKR